LRQSSLIFFKSEYGNLSTAFCSAILSLFVICARRWISSSLDSGSFSLCIAAAVVELGAVVSVFPDVLPLCWLTLLPAFLIDSISQ
jgi:hypothetical protein